MGRSPHSQQGKPPVAPPPPVYWPQPAPQALQRKVTGEGQQNGVPAPKAIQTRSASAQSPRTGPQVTPPPPVYWPQPAPHVLQRKAAGEEQPNALQAKGAHGARPVVVQAACNCRKSGNKHASSCPANPKQKKAKAKKDKVVHQESQSIRNLYAYDSVWANAQAPTITNKMVNAFVKTYGVIHGHATSRADKDAKRHANTTKDINAFHSWYGQNSQNY